jgi:hypothetical protein
MKIGAMVARRPVFVRPYLYDSYRPTVISSNIHEMWPITMGNSLLDNYSVRQIILCFYRTIRFTIMTNFILGFVHRLYVTNHNV